MFVRLNFGFRGGGKGEGDRRSEGKGEGGDEGGGTHLTFGFNELVKA